MNGIHLGDIGKNIAVYTTDPRFLQFIHHTFQFLLAQRRVNPPHKIKISVKRAVREYLPLSPEGGLETVFCPKGVKSHNRGDYLLGRCGTEQDVLPVGIQDRVRSEVINHDADIGPGR